MNFKVNFSEQNEGLSARFGEVQNVGTTDHDLLTNRCIPDQHCIGSITGLEEALAEKLPASSFVFGTTDGTVYEGSAGAKNAEDIAFVKQVLIEAGTITKIEVEQAYTSRVTANCENIVDGQKTPVTMIKGSTVRCENLIPFPYKGDVKNVGDTFVINGLTYKVNDDGSITVKGTSTARADCNLFPMADSFTIPIGTYTISGCPQGVTQSVGQFQFIVKYADGTTNDTFLGANQLKTIEITQEVVGIYVNIVTLSGQTMNNITFKPMLNVGSTALPYQPYFTDLKHAKIDKIVSTGRNLLDISKLVGDALVDNGDGTYTMTKNGNTRFSKEWIPEKPLYLGDFYPHMEVLSENIKSDDIAVQGTYENGGITTFALRDFNSVTKWTRNKPIVRFVLYLNWDEENGAYITFKNPAFSRDKSYTPFIQETYQLPETLELPEWDSFNPQTGEITRGTGKLVLTGSEEWGVENATYGGNNFYTNPIENASGKQSVICNHYNSNLGESTAVADNAFITNTKRLNITASNFTTVEEWKAYLADLHNEGTPLIVEYQLATPTVEKLEYAPKSYTAYNQGNETAVLENAEFGAIPTITNEYFKITEN